MKLSAMVCLVLLASTAHAAASSLPCAVEGMSRGVKPDALCQALARQLGREISLIHDAREAKQGEAIQLISGDVDWTVVWLVGGRVRTWTRVSKIDPVGEQVKLLARAARELAEQAKEMDKAAAGCLRLVQGNTRHPDLSYPWAELSPCKRKRVEVPDPWWLPARGTPAP
jgi:hypothetical protein